MNERKNLKKSILTRIYFQIKEKRFKKLANRTPCKQIKKETIVYLKIPIFFRI